MNKTIHKLLTLACRYYLQRTGEDKAADAAPYTRESIPAAAGLNHFVAPTAEELKQLTVQEIFYEMDRIYDDLEKARKSAKEAEQFFHKYRTWYQEAHTALVHELHAAAHGTRHRSSSPTPNSYIANPRLTTTA